jgi:hypothetical protein
LKEMNPSPKRLHLMQVWNVLLIILKQCKTSNQSWQLSI